MSPTTTRAKPKRFRRALYILLALLFVGSLTLGGLWLAAKDPMGGTAAGKRLARMRRSPQWRVRGFKNRLPRVDGPMFQMLVEALLGGSDHRQPTGSLKVHFRQRQDFERLPESGLRATWLGHSTLLVELDGTRLLIDPVWGERASPFTWIGPRRFFKPPLALGDLPRIDAVLISHDHYDHLDYSTVRRLRDAPAKWVVPLGVGAHLESWGVSPQRIVELDWWQETQVQGVALTCTPSRHFSGRSILFHDQNATLWAGWAMRGPKHRVFYSGDTAMHPEFARIGERLGPFDLTMIEVGAYNALWADVHLGPEQAVIAHQMVKGRLLLPVHWGTFDLATHGWTEPIERISLAARRAGVRLATPPPGGSVEPAQAGSFDKWWPDRPWQAVSKAPAWSSNVDKILSRHGAALGW